MSLSTCETVATETPALRATSAMVGIDGSPLRVRPRGPPVPAYARIGRRTATAYWPGPYPITGGRVNACAIACATRSVGHRIRPARPATHPAGRLRPPDIVALHTP
ncbi:hypothetical protein GCM10010279_57820 [Streptomyces mutabilis]|nr:hypothetical protein GCM10010279_57820 [Streptomyces mutabilis]